MSNEETWCWLDAPLPRCHQLYTALWGNVHGRRSSARSTAQNLHALYDGVGRYAAVFVPSRRAAARSHAPRCTLTNRNNDSDTRCQCSARYPVRCNSGCSASCALWGPYTCGLRTHARLTLPRCERRSFPLLDSHPLRAAASLIPDPGHTAGTPRRAVAATGVMHHVNSAICVAIQTSTGR